MPEAEIIAFHGWGFDASCWQEWEKSFGTDFSFHCSERGYFGKSVQTPVFTATDIPKMILAHSFGFHLCPDNLFREADMVIVFNGFLDFHPVSAQYKRRSKLMLNQMMNRLEGNPGRVLKDFYQNTFYPQPPGKPPESKPQKERLLKDLQTLDISKIDARVLKSVNKMCILHGFDDAVVPRRKGRELYDCFPESAQYFEVKNAGHALPFTHAEQCRQFIEPEIKELTS